MGKSNAWENVNNITSFIITVSPLRRVSGQDSTLRTSNCQALSTEHSSPLGPDPSPSRWPSPTLQSKKPKIRPQNPMNPRIPWKALLLRNPIQSLLLAPFFAASLLSRGRHSPVSFPINFLCEVCCTMWLCGIPWLLTHFLLWDITQILFWLYKMNV